MAEQRGHGDFAMKLARGSAPNVFVLTSIVWREAWNAALGARLPGWKAIDAIGGALGHLAVTAQPLSADFAGTRFIQLYLYAHRVDGLQPGVYRFWPECAELEQVKSGDQRVAAAGLSLGQDLAGNACVTFSMIGDLGRAAHTYGDRGYRYPHFEAGAIGHRLYLAAETPGLGATGIGAFYDDEVHHHLNLIPKQGQVVYHFAIGYPVVSA